MDGARPDHRFTNDPTSNPKKIRSGFLIRILGRLRQAPTAPVEADVAEVLLARLKRSSPTAMLAHVVLALGLPLVFWGQAPLWALVSWTGAILVASLWRLRSRRRTEVLMTARGVTRGFGLGPLVLASAWALGPLLLGAYFDFSGQLLTLVIFAGLVGGGSSTLDADPQVFRGITFILLGSATARLLVDGLSQAHLSAVALTVFFATIMVSLNANLHRELVERLRKEAQAGRTEARAAQHQAFLTALLESSPIAIATLGTDNKVMSVNPAFERLFGYTLGEVGGRALNDFIVPPDQRDAALRLDDSVAESGTVVAELLRQRKDGSKVHVRVSAALAKAEASGAIFALYDDITAVREAERKVRATEAQYRSLVETASDLVWQVDLDGRWTFVNETCERIYGVSPEELIGQRFFDWTHPDHVEKDAEAWREVLAGAELTDYETEHRATSGETRYLSFAARPMRDEHGDIVGVSGTARDVTERVSARRDLEEARQTAERTAEAKGAFLANMSHEIRTPMNGILGMTELLLDSHLDAEQRRAAELVRESGEALLTIINDILDFSKIESGRMEVERTEFELAALIESTVRLLSVKAFERGIELTCDVAPKVPHRVLGDPGRLRQVLNNLVGNAIKFTEKGDVAVTVMEVSSTPEKCTVGISVRDTGIGIADDNLETIFEEFTQADITTTRRYGGTGLGLAITRKLVTMLGGQMEVTSVLGEGSEFTLTLPLVVVESEHPTPVSRDAELHDIRVLIIDDHGTNRRIVRNMLEPAGVEVEEAPDGEIGLSMLRKASTEGRAFGVVVVDGQMPTLDGFGVAARVRGDPKLAETRLMMLTSGGRPGDGRRCRELGITGYLSKPASRSELLETLVAVVSGPPGAGGSSTLITRHFIQENRRPLRILLAEDNPVNQQVAATMLRKRGHQVDVVEDGQAALDAVRRQGFDLVLMDMQMPVMDGITSTKKIREDSGNANLPIIAVTAHALQEERNRCLEAGMSGYLPKPFKPHELFAIVERWGTAPTETLVPTVDTDPSAPVELAGFRSSMKEAGVEEAVDAMLDVFIRDAPGRMRGLVTAIEAGNVAEIEAMAHAFKSASSTIGARPLASVLQSLESAGRNQQAERAQAMLPQLRTEYEVAMTYLSTALGRNTGA